MWSATCARWQKPVFGLAGQLTEGEDVHLRFGAARSLLAWETQCCLWAHGSARISLTLSPGRGQVLKAAQIVVNVQPSSINSRVWAKALHKSNRYWYKTNEIPPPHTHTHTYTYFHYFKQKWGGEKKVHFKIHANSYPSINLLVPKLPSKGQRLWSMQFPINKWRIETESFKLN